MKRIGILTYHCIPNFGAQLQALSTIGYLKNNNYEPIILNWYPEDLEEFYKKRAPQCQNEKQFTFSQKHMPVSKLCRTLPELCEEIELLELDAVILGSDALFDYTPEKYRYNLSLKKLRKIPIKITSNHLLPNPFWGSFNDYLNNRMRILGYAISSQNMPYKDLNSAERKELKRHLKGFDKITVRDEWTKSMVENIGGLREIEIVPDPVFAFNQNYSNIPSKKEILNRFGLPEEYILISFVYPILTDQYVNEIIRLIKQKTDIDCVSFPMPDKLRKFDTPYTIDLPLSPVDWYAIIKYSKGYIGERMHPIVVCLHNSVPFYCFDQYGAHIEMIPRVWTRFIPESSKIYDILCSAELQDYSTFYSRVKGISPEYVVTKFCGFPTTKSELFSKKQTTRYNDGMSSLLKNLE